MTSILESSTLSQLKTLAIAPPVYLLGGFIAVWLLWNKFQPGLVGIPGPKLAAYTKLWRVYDVWSGTAHLTAIKLHKKIRQASSHCSEPCLDFGSRLHPCVLRYQGGLHQDRVLSHTIYLLEKAT